MLKYWAKNRLTIDILLGIILALLFSFAFVTPSFNSYRNIVAENSIYVNTKIDYQLPNPSFDQLGEIKSLDFVDDAFGYIFTKTNIDGKKSSKMNLLMSDNIDSIDMTMFGEKSLKSKISKIDSYAYIDENAASVLNVKLGDIVTISLASSKLQYTVCGLYESTTLYPEGVVFVEYSGQVKTVYESNVSTKGYSGAFIDASNEQKCKDYLKTYIPKGRLKDRSEFSSDEAYELYKNSILNGNYSNEITDFCSQRPTAINLVGKEKASLTSLAFIGGVVAGVILFAANEILRFRKSENKYFAEILKNKKEIAKYRWASFLTESLFYIAGVLILALLTTNVSTVLLPTVTAFAIMAISHFASLLQDRTYVRKKITNK